MVIFSLLLSKFFSIGNKHHIVIHLNYCQKKIFEMMHINFRSNLGCRNICNINKDKIAHYKYQIVCILNIVDLTYEYYFLNFVGCSLHLSFKPPHSKYKRCSVLPDYHSTKTSWQEIWYVLCFI